MNAVLVGKARNFKTITMSTKKIDENDATTLAFYLSKNMLTQSHLCKQTSQEIRRLKNNKESFNPELM